MSRLLVMGDVHGAHRAMVQVLERAKFDPASDRLVFLGDVADGWPETRQCIDELLLIPNRVCLLGNHDAWFLEWLERGGVPAPIWTMQGGAATLASYDNEGVPRSHFDYLRTAKLWHQEGHRVFVHGGWDTTRYSHPMGAPRDELLWDRSLWRAALDRLTPGRSEPLTRFEVYIGHTTTTRVCITEPKEVCGVWNLDQGAGWEGRLSLLDADSKEYWQSDDVSTLYPEHRRRGAA